MKNLMPFNKKSKELSTRFEDFYDLMEDFFSDSSIPKRVIGKDFKMDVQDLEKEYVVEAELPGAKKEEVNVELRENRLKISFKKEEQLEDEGKNYIHKERRTSSMERSIYLPDSKAEGVSAKLENGVLTIKVQKETESSNKVKIEIE
ncbi:18 kDa heat shock protein [Andreesenia angusta]|uniref:18 kDa heat shock protein n=1 Tax=Andreesenia angusta TaxID=39480 RepID=A0A1S1V436_9FIRM|nr:Hsp20/alpha crystallin family protein [Andreesenia angusta]OHW61362.1 18 kDa heat shock protein [Andreesenia angusta]